MTQLQVEIADFREAATSMRHNVAEAVRICLDGVDLTPGLVGDDPAGRAWSTAYNRAAGSVLRATAQIANAAGATSVLFAYSGRNYARAEAESTPGGTSQVSDFDGLTTELPTVTAPSMPDAGGADDDTPSGWWLVEHTVGLVWPGGHQDRLRATAQQWRRAAGGLERTVNEPTLIAADFAVDRLPEANDVCTICRGLNTHLTSLTEAYRSLADACDSYARHLDDCHNAVRDELGDLVRDSAATQTFGAVLAIPTLGGSEVGAQGAQAGRIAVTAARITGLIHRMINAARTVAETVDRIHHIATEINKAVGPISTMHAVDAAVTRARRTPPAGKQVHVTTSAAEIAAARRLGNNTRIRRPLNARERKHILDGDGPNSGGHRHGGNPGKSHFPREWSDAKIVRTIEDIIMSTNTVWRADSGSGGIKTARGAPAVWRAWETKDGVVIRVVWEPATGHIFSAYPDPDTTPTGKVIT